MAVLIIKIEETHNTDNTGREMIGFSILDTYEGELQIVDALPGIKTLKERAVRGAIDSIFGMPVASSDESIEDARMQANRFMN